MNFTRILCASIAALGAISLPLAAQNAPAGPVHFPSGASTNAPNATLPKPALNIAPPANTPSLSGPVTPASAPVTTAIAPASSLTAPPVTNAPSALAPTMGAPSTAASADDGGDIHDIQGVISIPYPLMWMLYLLAAAVLAVGAWYLWKWLRRTVLKPKLPHEVALERLEASRALMTETQVREYAFAVSQVIRTYIEQRFGERAARRTTEEFLSDLLRQTNTPLAEHRALLEDFLNHCDLPKFARWQLSVGEMESMHKSARAFILNTAPGAPVHAPAPGAQPELVSAK